MDRFVIISGCSGGGKSSLLEELARRGHSVIEEPGRRIVVQEQESGGTALPWVDLAEFARRAFDLALADRGRAARRSGWVFFDRSLVDAASALMSVCGEDRLTDLATTERYAPIVFMTPPWPEIYREDGERRHTLDEAIAEHDRLMEVYPSLGYEVVMLPRIDIAGRADFVLARLAMLGPQPTAAG